MMKIFNMFTTTVLLFLVGVFLRSCNGSLIRIKHQTIPEPEFVTPEMLNANSDLFINVLQELKNNDNHKTIETFFEESIPFGTLLNRVFNFKQYRVDYEIVLKPKLEHPILMIYAELQQNMDKIFNNFLDYPKVSQNSSFDELYQISEKLKDFLHLFSLVAGEKKAEGRELNHFDEYCFEEDDFKPLLTKLYEELTISNTNNLLSKTYHDQFLEIFVTIHLWTSSQVAAFFHVYCVHHHFAAGLGYDNPLALQTATAYTTLVLQGIKESELTKSATMFDTTKILGFVEEYIKKNPNDDHEELSRKIKDGLSDKIPKRNWFVASFKLSDTDPKIGLAQHSAHSSLVEDKEIGRSVLVATTTMEYDNSCFQIRDSYDKCLDQTKATKRPRDEQNGVFEIQGVSTICETVVNEMKTCTKDMYAVIACFPTMELGISSNIDEHEQSIERVKARNRATRPDYSDLNSGGPEELFRLAWVQ